MDLMPCLPVFFFGILLLPKPPDPFLRYFPHSLPAEEVPKLSQQHESMTSILLIARQTWPQMCRSLRSPSLIMLIWLLWALLLA